MKFWKLAAILLLAVVAMTACGDDDDNDDNDSDADDDLNDDADDDSANDDDVSDDDDLIDDDDDGPPYPFEVPVFIDVFRSRDGNYPIYRIPSLITTTDGTLLAFAEGRQSVNDHSQNDMVMRRSTDGGFTWGSLDIIAEQGADCLSDPLPVQITIGPNAGRILFFYTLFPEGCHHDCVEPGYDGPKNSKNFLLTSDDDGMTWQGPIEVTRAFRPEEKNYVSGGPGFAIQKRLELHAGRIVLPFRESSPVMVLAIYSDDGGETWQRGQVADDSLIEGRVNEVQIAEMPDGSLYLNARSSGGQKLRRVARSYDGGETWTPLQNDEELVEPRCMAGILQFSGIDDGDIPRLLYTGPNNKYERIFGEVKLSYDNGETWPVSKVFWPGIFAYSVPTRINCQTVGVLFEDRIWVHDLTLAMLSIEWLTSGGDRPVCDR